MKEIQSKRRYILPQALRKLMFEKNMTVKDLSKILRTNPSLVYRWLNVEGVPSGSSLMQLGDIFNVKVDYLLYGDENV